MSGLKKPDVKPVVEATLAIIGEALSKGESLNLEPLGKMKVQRQKELANATVISCRVRRKKDQPDGQPNEPLAEAAE